MYVIKRDNRREKLDITKIKKYTEASVVGLKNVSAEELETDASILFYDGIKTTDIQQSLIRTALNKIDVDRPDWSFVAARLFLYDLYHKVSGYTGYPTLREYIDKGIKAGVLDPNLANGYDLEELDKYIKPERDLQFTYLGIKTLYDRYLIKDKDNNPIELPQHLFMGVAMLLAMYEKDKMYWTKKFYDIMSKFEVMMATPIISNARTNRRSLLSCYVKSVPDSIEGIFDAYKETALMSKYGGGIGESWVKVRGMGSTIDVYSGVAGGTIPFLRINNDVSIAVDQLGLRAGAIAVYNEPWHIDIMDFLELKNNAGEERRRTHELFPALWIPDLFMKRVNANAEWTLFDPYDVSDLTDLYGEEFENKYREYEKDDSIRKVKVNAKELWKKILKEYFETGSPYLAFKDEANRRNPNNHDGIIRSSNLCVTGDTKILTKEYGDIEIRKVAGKTLTCWNGFEWSKTELFKTSDKQKVLEVVLSNGVTIKATPYHKWYVNVNDIITEKRTYELNENDTITSYTLPTGETVDGITIISVKDNNEEKPTYCGTEPLRHTLLFNGIMTGNCTEIFQNTEPDDEEIVVTYYDNDEFITKKYNKDATIELMDGSIKRADKLLPMDSVCQYRVYQVEKKAIPGKSAVCNLGSINLSKINTKEDMERVIPIAVRMLDNIINLNNYPTKKTRDTSMRNRAIGLGVMGEMHMLANKHIHFGSNEHYELIDKIMEIFSYNTIKASMELAKERGTYPLFKDSKWSKGILPIDTANEEAKKLVNRSYIYDWNKLREDVKENGVRNGYMMAIAPTSSISIITGTSQAIEPIYKRKWYEVNSSGDIPVIAPDLNVENYQYYIPAHDIDQLKLVYAGAIRQKWIDQGQSLNIFIKPENARASILHKIYNTGHKLGLKSFYYLRSGSKEDTVDRKDECTVCQ